MDGTEIDDSSDKGNGFRTRNQFIDCAFVVFAFRVPFPSDRVKSISQFLFREAVTWIAWWRLEFFFFGWCGDFSLAERLDAVV